MSMKKENFAKAVEWLYANGKAKDQTDLSDITGITQTSISRILNGRVKQPSANTLRKFNAAFQGIFNMDFLLGNSDEMFAASTNIHHQTPNTHQPSTDFTPEQSKMINSMIAAYDETIVSMKRELAAKDDVIETKNKLIEALEQQIKDLRIQLTRINRDDLGKYPFPVGLAEDKTQRETGIVK